MSAQTKDPPNRRLIGRGRKTIVVGIWSLREMRQLQFYDTFKTSPFSVFQAIRQRFLNKLAYLSMLVLLLLGTNRCVLTQEYRPRPRFFACLCGFA